MLSARQLHIVDKRHPMSRAFAHPIVMTFASFWTPLATNEPDDDGLTKSLRENVSHVEREEMSEAEAEKDPTVDTIFSFARLTVLSLELLGNLGLLPFGLMR